MDPITDPKELLELTFRTEAREIFRQQLSLLRSSASRMKAVGLVEDEEEAFSELLTQYTNCFTDEICKLVGTEVATALLDPFSGPISPDAKAIADGETS